MNSRPERPDDPPQRQEGEAPDIADAAFLFEDEPKRLDRSGPRPADPPPQSYEVSGYEVADPDPDLSAGPSEISTPASIPPRARKPKPAEPELAMVRARSGGRSPSSEDRPGDVSQTWSRGAEWGPTLGVLAMVALLTLALIYVAISVGSLPLAFLVFLGGLGLCLILSYPIAITLERPVRLTPEQALKDYFEALSRRWPHYRRMWLLLGDRGRESSAFASFEEFRRYWRARIASVLRKAQARGPVELEVSEFKAEEKSVGKSWISATATVRVRPRGLDDAVENVRYKVRFVRGGDRMWYLEDATLPEPRESARPGAGTRVMDDEH